MIDIALLTTVNESNLNFPEIVKYKGMEAAWLASKVFLLSYIWYVTVFFHCVKCSRVYTVLIESLCIILLKVLNMLFDDGVNVMMTAQACLLQNIQYVRACVWSLVLTMPVCILYCVLTPLQLIICVMSDVMFYEMIGNGMSCTSHCCVNFPICLVLLLLWCSRSW